MLTPEVLMTILKIAGVFILASFVIFWVGLVWWVAQDVLSRTRNKIIVAAAVAITAMLGPVGTLLYLVIRPKQTLQESMGEMMDREMLLHASSTTICPTCGHMAQEDFLACPHCSTPLKEHCSHCTKLVAVNWSFCPFCATKLNPKILPQATSILAHPVANLAPNKPTRRLKKSINYRQHFSSVIQYLKNVAIATFKVLKRLVRSVGLLWAKTTPQPPFKPSSPNTDSPLPVEQVQNNAPPTQPITLTHKNEHRSSAHRRTKAHRVHKT